MSKRRTQDGIQKHPDSAPVAKPPAVPDVRLPVHDARPTTARPWMVRILLVVAAVVGVVVMVEWAKNYSAGILGSFGPWSAPRTNPATAKAAARYSRPENLLATNRPLDDAAKVVRDFAVRKNANDPLANGLLALAPEVPADPVPSAEAERLDADFILRDRYQVKEIWSLPPTDGGPVPTRFVLVVEGNPATPRYNVQTAPGGKPESHQRALFNPDILVRVQDGKIYGVSVRLHQDEP